MHDGEEAHLAKSTLTLQIHRAAPVTKAARALRSYSGSSTWSGQDQTSRGMGSAARSVSVIGASAFTPI
jgi:hypothetical protein